MTPNELKETLLLSSVNDVRWNGQDNLRADSRSTRDFDFDAYSGTPFLHSLNAEMAYYAGGEDLGIDPDPIVADAQAQVARVTKLYRELARMLMTACVSDAFLGDSGDLIPDDRMQISRFAGHIQSHGDRGALAALLRSPLQECRKLILLRCRRTQGLKGNSSFGDRLTKPSRDLLQGATHPSFVRRSCKSVVGNQLAALDGLKKRVVKFARHAGTFIQTCVKSNALTWGSSKSRGLRCTNGRLYLGDRLHRRY